MLIGPDKDWVIGPDRKRYDKHDRRKIFSSRAEVAAFVKRYFGIFRLYTKENALILIDPLRAKAEQIHIQF